MNSYKPVEQQQQAGMLKLKSQSLVVSEYEENVLRNHLERLVEQSEDKINRKMQWQQQKEARLQALQQKYVEEVTQKEREIQQKIEKSVKKKEEHVNSIVKKCKDHDKYLGEKLRNHQNKKKASLREAWKISEKYKEFAQEKELHKNSSQGKPLFNREASESRLLNKSFQKKEERAHEENKAKEFRVSSKKTNHSVKYLRLPDSIHNLAETEQEKEQNKAREKLQMTLDRFKKNNVEAEQAKIQQLGELLQKIEQGRMRKLGLIKKRKENHHSNYLRHQSKERKMENTERVHSEQSKARQRRTRDWSQATKNKRAEFFQAHLQNSNEYLSSQKLKFIKTKLAKKIVHTAIQKKLYFQRLHH